MGDVGFVVLAFCGHLCFEHFLRRSVDVLKYFNESGRYHKSFHYHVRRGGIRLGAELAIRLDHPLVMVMLMLIRSMVVITGSADVIKIGRSGAAVMHGAAGRNG